MSIISISRKGEMTFKTTMLITLCDGLLTVQVASAIWNCPSDTAHFASHGGIFHWLEIREPGDFFDLHDECQSKLFSFFIQDFIFVQIFIKILVCVHIPK